MTPARANSGQAAKRPVAATPGASLPLDASALSIVGGADKSGRAGDKDLHCASSGLGQESSTAVHNTFNDQRHLEKPRASQRRRRTGSRTVFLRRCEAIRQSVRQDDPIPAELIELIFLNCRVSMQEFDLDTHHVVVVLAALVRAVVTASAAVELALWRAISDTQRRTDRRDCVGLGHDQ